MVEIVIITDKRFMINSGIIATKCSMLPVGKVTDMNLLRPRAGRLLGYGTLKIESTAQNQDLETIKYLSQPEAFFAAISELMFGEKQPRSRMVPMLSIKHLDTLSIRYQIAYYTGRAGDVGTALRLYRELLADQGTGTRSRPPQQPIPPGPGRLLHRPGRGPRRCVEVVPRITGRPGTDARHRPPRKLVHSRQRWKRVLGTAHPNSQVARASIAYYTIGREARRCIAVLPRSASRPGASTRSR